MISMVIFSVLPYVITKSSTMQKQSLSLRLLGLPSLADHSNEERDFPFFTLIRVYGHNKMKQRLKNNERLIGMCINYPAAGIIETVGSMWDFLWLDGQHGQISQDQMLSLVRTADLVGVDSLVRVPGREFGIVGPYADMAPSALMIPMINTAEDAAAVVDAMRFPPLGSRSFGGRRAIDTLSRQYYKEKEPVLIAQIETPEALENIQAIANTDGIDVLMLGPDDFKITLGLPVDSPLLETPEISHALKKVAEVAVNAGKHAACIAPTPELLKYTLELGYSLFIGGGDVAFLREGATQRTEMMRQFLEQGTEDKV